MYLPLRFPLASLLLLMLVVCNADAANPSRPFKGVGIGETMFVPHPTLPAPFVLLQAKEVGNYTHFGRATIITMSGDFNPDTGTLTNGKSVTTAADGSMANATWSDSGPSS